LIKTASTQLIAGPAGNLEILVTIPKKQSNNVFAVICHPHPLHGGAMTNKVVYIIARSFNELGIGTVRFNFRGVGNSTGQFDNGKGETDDLRAVVNWLKKESAFSELWLAGFSFGSEIALRGHRDLNAHRLLLVAPPVERFQAKNLPLSDIPTLVIQGDKDEIVSPTAVSAWVKTQAHQPEYIIMAEAEHFFHGRLNELRDMITTAWGN
jgi:alpha/beta superfamily hydrolase